MEQPIAGQQQQQLLYIQQQHLPFYLEDCGSLILQGEVENAPAFLAEYFTAVVSGKHVTGRDFSYVAGTPHNRASFLRAARQALESVVHVGGDLAQGDVLSCLRLLCSNFSAGAVRNAWSSAVTLHAEAAGSQAQQESRRAKGRAPLGLLLDVLEVTFLYERFLMALRCRCFDAAKACCRFQELEADSAAVAHDMSAQGWPAPSAAVMAAALQQASLSGQQPCFGFTELVRALCRSQELQAELRAADAAAADAAAAAGKLHALYKTAPHISGALNGVPGLGAAGQAPQSQMDTSTDSRPADRAQQQRPKAVSAGTTRSHFRV